ncbi:MAG: sigma-70 family RNA polymerase sigma factor [Phycisphaeraceae bacterium]|nr:sigma-70 family RNA polymerase sigma factor [Phycisphaerales bacterium]MCB9860094.1 sigma-70 family RNA polymerase sigma factor [Phycisphaeraceae bacterium]
MDRDRFEQLALSQLDAVYRMAFHLTRDPDAASDLVQDVYARALRPRAVAGFEDRSDETQSAEETPSKRSPESGMRSWLFTITHNVFYSKVKRASRAPAAVGEFFESSDTERRPDQPLPATCLADLNWDHVDGRLKEVIESLKPEYREVLMLWGIEGLKYREIGQILDIPIGTVMSRLHRARKLVIDGITSDDKLASDLGVARLASGSQHDLDLESNDNS